MAFRSPLGRRGLLIGSMGGRGTRTLQVLLRLGKPESPPASVTVEVIGVGCRRKVLHVHVGQGQVVGAAVVFGGRAGLSFRCLRKPVP